MDRDDSGFDPRITCHTPRILLGSIGRVLERRFAWPAKGALFRTRSRRRAAEDSRRACAKRSFYFGFARRPRPCAGCAAGFLIPLRTTPAPLRGLCFARRAPPAIPRARSDRIGRFARDDHADMAQGRREAIRVRQFLCERRCRRRRHDAVVARHDDEARRRDPRRQNARPRHAPAPLPSRSSPHHPPRHACATVKAASFRQPDRVERLAQRGGKRRRAIHAGKLPAVAKPGL